MILFIFVCLVSTLQLGKTDPTKRIFIKTFNQFTNQYFIKNKTKKLLDEGFELDKDLIRDNILIFSKDHTGHFKLALYLFKENPIFGVGTKMFRVICNDEKYRLVDIVNGTELVRSCSTHPHNVFLQLLTETGLVGFLPIFVLFIFIVYYFF